MIARDKKLHFIVGTGTSVFVYGALYWLGFTTPATEAFLAAVAAGACKELWDFLSGKGTPELADFWYTIAGGALGVIIGVSVVVNFAL